MRTRPLPKPLSWRPEGEESPGSVGQRQKGEPDLVIAPRMGQIGEVRQQTGGGEGEPPAPRRGVDRKQLLREAKEAALSYVSDCVPPREEKLLRFLVPFLLGALSCLVVLTLIRLL